MKTGLCAAGLLSVAAISRGVAPMWGALYPSQPLRIQS